MVADADFSDYLHARWPVLVAALEAEGLPGDEARLAVAEVLESHRRGWRSLVEAENVDVRIWQVLRERARLPAQPGATPPVTSGVLDPSRPVDPPEPWLERAATMRRARRTTTTARWLIGLAVAAAVVVGLGLWGWGSRAPAVREETNPLPVIWYAGDELHLAEVVVELPDVESFIALGDGAAVRRADGTAITVDDDGKVSSLADPPQELAFPPELPDYLPFGSFTSVVQGAPAPGDRWAYVLDSRRRGATDPSRILVLCDAALVCQQVGTGVPAEGFRLR